MKEPTRSARSDYSMPIMQVISQSTVNEALRDLQERKIAPFQLSKASLSVVNGRKKHYGQHLAVPEDYDR